MRVCRVSVVACQALKLISSTVTTSLRRRRGSQWRSSPAMILQRHSQTVELCVCCSDTVCQVLYFLVSFYISAAHCSIVCGSLRQQFQRKYGQSCSSASKHLLAFPLNFSLSIFFLLKQQLACYSYVLLIQLTFFTQSFLLWQRVKWRRYKKVSKSFYGLKTRNTGELLHGLKSYDQVPVVRKHLPSDWYFILQVK